MKLAAANELKKFLNSLKSIQEVLEADGVSEQVAAEHKKDIEKLKVEKQAMLSEVQGIKSEISKLSDEKKMAASNLANLKEVDKKEFDTNHGLLKAKFAEIEKGFSNEIAELQAHKDSMHKELARLAQEISSKQAAYQEAVDKIESLKRGL